jgi:hypothetical protein
MYSWVLLESVLLNHSSFSRVLLESAAESFVLLPGFIGVCAAESFVLLPGFIGVCAAQSFVLYVVFWVFTPGFYWNQIKPESKTNDSAADSNKTRE